MISVIIPTHDRPDLLRRAIRSVLAQNLQPYEVIIVDDIGTLETEKVVEEFQSSLIRYVHNKEGKGATSSRNLGATLAQGKYIAFLDDDDEWLESKLYKQFSLLQKRGLDACFSQIKIQYENSSLSYSTKAKLPDKPLISILQENFIGATITAVIRRSVFLSLGGFDSVFKAREEYDLWIKIILNGYQVGVIEEPLAISYRSLENRSRISANINSYIDAVEKLNYKYEKEVAAYLSDSQRMERRRMQFDFLAAQAISIGLRGVAANYYLKSLWIKPSIKTIVALFAGLTSPKLLIKLRSVL